MIQGNDDGIMQRKGQKLLVPAQLNDQLILVEAELHGDLISSYIILQFGAEILG
jgi:hypothetical protein